MNSEVKKDNIAYFQQFIGQKMSKENTPSAVGAWLQGKLLQVKAGSLKVEFEVKQDWINPIGTLHGGMMALIADEVIGATIFTLGLNSVYVSVNLNINYLKTAKLGDIVIAETNIVKQGRSVINSNCNIYNNKQELIATVNANNMKI